jgi:ABC-2 type transport system ATP-binding protein
MSSVSWTNQPTSSAESLITIRDLGVDYGTRRALDAVNLRVPAGEIFGLLGPNGAGKTTLFRVLATLLQPARGEIELCGITLGRNSREIRSQITYMPDLAPLPSDLRAIEYLHFYAGAYGLRGKLRTSRVAHCLDVVDLSDRKNDICTHLSLGMRQRLALAKAILHQPRLLILDEPASGMDPMARIELRKALRQQAAGGVTVIMSSHVIAEIEDLCTSIGLLHQGRLLDAGPLHDVLARFANSGVRVVIQAPGRLREVAAWLRDLPGISLGSSGAHDLDSLEVMLDESIISLSELFTRLGAARLGVISMETLQTRAEEVLIRLAAHEPQP